MSQITANCSSAKKTFGFAGPVGFTTPYLDGTDLFQRICYTPPFITETDSALDCVETFATMKGCAWDIECNLGEVCQNSICTPSIETVARFKNGNGISNIQPQAKKWFARDDARVAEFVPAPYNRSADSVKDYLAQTCPSSTGVFVTECNGPNCNDTLSCPYFNSVQQNNCMNCVKILTDCDPQRGKMTDAQYKECKKVQDIFQYQVASPNGNIWPLSYSMHPDHIDTVGQVLTQCARDCAVTTTLTI